MATPPLLQIPDHESLRLVGEGAYGEVWLGRNVMRTFRAVKIVYGRSFSMIAEDETCAKGRCY